jgi:hypothetical protein
MALGSTNPPFDSGELLLLEELGPEAAPPPPPEAGGALLELELLELELLELGPEPLLELLLEAPPPAEGALAGPFLRGCMAMAAIPVPMHRMITAVESADFFFISLPIGLGRRPEQSWLTGQAAVAVAAALSS